MGAINTNFLMNFEARMQVIQEENYLKILQNLWWDKVVRSRTTDAEKDILTWILSTAQIRDDDAGGAVTFEDLVTNMTTVETKFPGAGFKIKKSQLEDSDGRGLAFGAKWAQDMGGQMAYWPQVRATHFLKNAHLAATAGGYNSYDGEIFFSQSHPLNPYRVSAGTFSNLLTGAASGVYPGACPIHDGVTVDVALANLGKIFSYAASIKMPNGVTPRYLRPAYVVCGPRMFPRAVQLTSAKMVAQAASSGGGGADVEALIKALGFATPVMADELAGFEDDTSFFVILMEPTDSELAAAVYTEREAFYMGTYGPMNSAQLSRMQEFEWHVHGRNGLTAGHPHAILKVKGT